MITLNGLTFFVSSEVTIGESNAATDDTVVVIPFRTLANLFLKKDWICLLDNKTRENKIILRLGDSSYLPLSILIFLTCCCIDHLWFTQFCLIHHKTVATYTSVRCQYGWLEIPRYWEPELSNTSPVVPLRLSSRQVPCNSSKSRKELIVLNLLQSEILWMLPFSFNIFVIVWVILLWILGFIFLSFRQTTAFYFLWNIFILLVLVI